MNKDIMKYIKITILALSAIIALLAFVHSAYFLTDVRWVRLGMDRVFVNELIASALTSLALSVLANSIDKK